MQFCNCHSFAHTQNVLNLPLAVRAKELGAMGGNPTIFLPAATGDGLKTGDSHGRGETGGSLLSSCRWVC